MSLIEAQAPYIAPVPQRARNTLVGTSLAVACMFMYFAVLIGIYVSERSETIAEIGSWIPRGVRIELTAPSVILWTFLLSVVTIQWAVYAAARNDRAHLLIALAVTALFGVAIINQFFFIFRQMGFVIDGGSKAAPLIYTLLGSFIAAVIIALIFFLVAGLRGLSGETTKPNTQLVASAALYWDSLVVIYFIIWIAIFVTK